MLRRRLTRHVTGRRFDQTTPPARHRVSRACRWAPGLDQESTGISRLECLTDSPAPRDSKAREDLLHFIKGGSVQKMPREQYLDAHD